jgi:hypothetical protein
MVKGCHFHTISRKELVYLETITSPVAADRRRPPKKTTPANKIEPLLKTGLSVKNRHAFQYGLDIAIVKQSNDSPSDQFNEF